MDISKITSLSRGALNSTSFIQFVQEIEKHGLLLKFAGLIPCVVHAGRDFKFSLLGMRKDFICRLSEWDQFDYESNWDYCTGNSLHLRTVWSRLYNWKEDIHPVNFTGLKYFQNMLGAEDISDAMLVTFRKKAFRGENGRYQFFCGVCHKKIKQNRNRAVKRPFSKMTRRSHLKSA